MKIPTLELLLTLEIFAELCGCCRLDFLKNPKSVTFISVCVLWTRECAPLWFIWATFLMKLRCFIAYEPFWGSRYSYIFYRDIFLLANWLSQNPFYYFEPSYSRQECLMSQIRLLKLCDNTWSNKTFCYQLLIKTEEASPKFWMSLSNKNRGVEFLKELNINFQNPSTINNYKRKVRNEMFYSFR